jgi:acetone carboxylase gamma subunit
VINVKEIEDILREFFPNGDVPDATLEEAMAIAARLEEELNRIQPE